MDPLVGHGDDIGEPFVLRTCRTSNKKYLPWRRRFRSTTPNPREGRPLCAVTVKALGSLVLFGMAVFHFSMRHSVGSRSVGRGNDLTGRRSDDIAYEMVAGCRRAIGKCAEGKGAIREHDIRTCIIWFRNRMRQATMDKAGRGNEKCRPLQRQRTPVLPSSKVRQIY